MIGETTDRVFRWFKTAGEANDTVMGWSATTGEVRDGVLERQGAGAVWGGQ